MNLCGLYIISIIWYTDNKGHVLKQKSTYLYTIIVVLHLDNSSSTLLQILM